MSQDKLIEAQALARSNLSVDVKNVALEVSRVYHLIRNNREVHAGFDKFFIIEAFRNALKDKGLVMLVHRLYPAMIIAALQMNEINPADIQELPEEVCDLVLYAAKKHGFALTRFEILRAFRILKKKPEYFEQNMRDDIAFTLSKPLKRPLYRQGNLTDLTDNQKSSVVKFAGFPASNPKLSYSARHHIAGSGGKGFT